MRSVKLIFHFLFKKKSQGTFASVALFSLVMMIFSSIAILSCGTSPESNIKTAGDVLWWSFVTITTVGYGDYYPTTIEGRIIVVLLMTTGVGFFGTFTAYVASFFIHSAPAAQSEREDEILSELRRLRDKIEQIERKQKEGR